jgi:predicted anti-sigma-YlaC factor YlaD
MTCPGALELFDALEQGGGEIREHLRVCERCRARADDESALSAALDRLRDPAPPVDLITTVLARIGAREALEARNQRQLWSALALTLAAATVALGLFWRGLTASAAAESVQSLVALQSAGYALIGALHLDGSTGPLAYLEATALLLTSWVLYRLIPARGRLSRS